MDSEIEFGFGNEIKLLSKITTFLDETVSKRILLFMLL